MQINELRDLIQASGDSAVEAALSDCVRAVGNLTVPCRVVNCELSKGINAGFAIHVLFPLKVRDLPLLELRYSKAGLPPLSVQLVAVENSETCPLSANLVKPGPDQYEAVWGAVTQASTMLWRMSPPDVNAVF